MMPFTENIYPSDKTYWQRDFVSFLQPHIQIFYKPKLKKAQLVAHVGGQLLNNGFFQVDILGEAALDTPLKTLLLERLNQYLRQPKDTTDSLWQQLIEFCGCDKNQNDVLEWVYVESDPTLATAQSNNSHEPVKIETQNHRILHHHQAIKTNWREGYVDFNESHFALIYGDAFDEDKCMTLGYIGPPIKGCFCVCFTSTSKEDIEKSAAAIKAAKAELDFYLYELPCERQLDASEVWDYQRYHCGTSANIYGKVHWRFVQK